MFEHVVEKLNTSPQFCEDAQKWCEQWCRMVNAGNDRENLSHPYGLLIASASQSNPTALEKLVAAMWSDVRTGFTSNPQSSLKTAVGTLLSVSAPLDAHLALMQALKNQHQKYWTDAHASKRQAMFDGVHVQTLSSVMDHIAHAYIIPIEDKLSAPQLSTLLEHAGPVFVERFAKICANYTPSKDMLVAFEGLSAEVSNDVILRLFESHSRDSSALLKCVGANTTLNEVVEAACGKNPDNLQALEVDQLHFPAMCFASQSSDPKAIDQVLNRRGHAHGVVHAVAGAWKQLLELYPDEQLSPQNGEMLQKFMVYCQPQYDFGISESMYAQLQNALLRSQTSTTSFAPKNRKM